MNLIIKKIRRKLAALYNAKPYRLVPNKAIVTFTFDDVPRSAITVGAKILEKQNVSGTFYLSGALADENNMGLEQYKEEDIKKLLDGGHEVGCHTYGHINILNASSAEIESDLDENLKYLKSQIGDHDLTGFSYPFGCVSITAKNIIRKRFSAARGTKSGINAGLADLSQLKANFLYNKNVTKEDITYLINSTIEDSGWLIFYTHDVSDEPTQHGCSPELLEFAVRQAVDQNCDVLCMRSALAKKVFK